MKNPWKKFACALALALAFVMPQMAAPTEAADQPQRPILSVDGRGEATTEPDMATVAVGITTHAADAAKAQNDNAWVAGEIQKSITALGIAEKDIQTRNYSFRPTYRLCPTPYRLRYCPCRLCLPCCRRYRKKQAAQPLSGSAEISVPWRHRYSADKTPQIPSLFPALL